MATCAYCDGDGTLTREHVVPSFLYDLVDKNFVRGKNGWLESKKARIPTDIKVKDVCSHCNNVLLGALDGHGKEFVLSNDLTSPLLADAFTLTYSYHLLRRWLMKILFNSSRASQEASHPAMHYRDYMLHGRNPPAEEHVFLFGYLLSPHVVTSPDSLAFGCSNSDGLANPFFIRLTRSVLPPGDAKNLLIESVGFGGLFLYVGFVSPDMKPKLAKKIRARVLRSDLFAPLSPTETSVRLRASTLDFVDFSAPQRYREDELASSGRDPFR
ncbi:hypothetical protein [Acidovorax sp. NCPPB 4044]|uniref:hypothetical protein n=1 Tax=Acidovorax sp. NCPPB 4044 TaxID=2940490 RepID=UPI002302BD61|nr:hypothetical protein [Acidovorax sp. NCPPB 4044]MDA8521547.1 hypothetical protein [Acidovorax sp. NCPPB 4044]